MRQGSAVRRPKERGPRRPLWALLVLPLLGGLFLGGCSLGTYPIDIFQEMHYSQAYRVQEVPRLSRPDGVEPFRQAGAEAVLEAPRSYHLLSFAEIRQTSNPLPWTEQALARAQELFRVDCAGCHGAQGDAKVFVADRFGFSGVQKPVNFVQRDPANPDRFFSRTEGELFWIVTHGSKALGEPAATPPRGNMPSFRKFLSDEERWTLVHLLVELRKGAGP